MGLSSWILYSNMMSERETARARSWMGPRRDLIQRPRLGKNGFCAWGLAVWEKAGENKGSSAASRVVAWLRLKAWAFCGWARASLTALPCAPPVLEVGRLQPFFCLS